MTGSIDTMSLDEARSQSVSDQSRLTSFGDDDNGSTTYVGIVRSENERYLDAVTEVEQRLAPPSELFHQWWETKKRLCDEEMLETNAHNEALDRVNYFVRFEKHLNNSEQQLALQQITERVRGGEDIVLVCFCSNGEQCHRHAVEARIDSRISP